MFELFILDYCGYCKKVMSFMNEHGIPYRTINIEEPQNEEELIRLGGKRQVPFLIDRERNVEMYESDDIIEYLKTLL